MAVRLQLPVNAGDEMAPTLGLLNLEVAVEHSSLIPILVGISSH